MADVMGGARDRAQLLLIGALALAVVFLSLSLLLNSVIYTENLATRQTHAGVDKASDLRLVVADGLGDAVAHANRRSGLDFDDRRNVYRTVTDAWIRTLANYTATDGMAAGVSRAGVREGARIVDNDSTTGLVRGDGAGDWTVATDSSVRAFALEIDPASVDSGDDVRITFENGTATTVVIENTGSGPQVRASSSGAPACQLTDGYVDITAGRVDGEYCAALSEVAPTGTVDVRIRNGGQIRGTYSLVVDRPEAGLRSTVDVTNFPGQCTPPSPRTYADSDADDPYTTPAIYAATARLDIHTQDLDHQRTVRTAPGEAGGPVTEPTFMLYNVTQSGNDLTVDWNASDPNGDLAHVDVRIHYYSNGSVYASDLNAPVNDTRTFASVPSGTVYYVNATAVDAGSTRQVSEIRGTGACPP